MYIRTRSVTSLLIDILKDEASHLQGTGVLVHLKHPVIEVQISSF